MAEFLNVETVSIWGGLSSFLGLVVGAVALLVGVLSLVCGFWLNQKAAVALSEMRALLDERSSHEEEVFAMMRDVVMRVLQPPHPSNRALRGQTDVRVGSSRGASARTESVCDAILEATIAASSDDRDPTAAQVWSLVHRSFGFHEFIEQIYRLRNDGRVWLSDVEVAATTHVAICA
ncbi:MAG: hypothetical protein AAF430_21545 [Myxococcota bacterium]